jgi:methyl-accepting chemotaxis protein
MRISPSSIYFKSLAILLVSCGILAAIVSLLGDRASRRVAEDGVRLLAEAETAVLADQLPGAVRFRKIDDIEARTRFILGSGELARAILVTDGQGETLLRLGEALSSDDQKRMLDLIRRALDTGEPSRSADGLTIARPIRTGDGQSSVGAVASSWTNRPFMLTIAAYRNMQIVGAAGTLMLLIAIAALAISRMISGPIDRITKRAGALAKGDLSSQTPETENRSEVGQLATAMEDLRLALLSAEEDRETAFLRSSGFAASSAPALMCDPELTITFTNRAFDSLMAQYQDAFRRRIPDFDPNAMIGRSVPPFATGIPRFPETSGSPFVEDLEIGDDVLQVSVVPLQDASGRLLGYVMEWTDVTEVRKNAAILSALVEGQLRANYDRDGKLISGNAKFRERTGTAGASATLSGSVTRDDGTPIWGELSSGRAFLGRYRLTLGGKELIVDGSISPVKAKDDKPRGYVLMGKDSTEELTRLETANERSARLSAAQKHVVSELRAAMRALSAGDLRYRIENPFEGDDDVLRSDFNSAVAALDNAIGQILDSAHMIRGEAGSVSSAADAFSHRTEKQAATLEETAAAIAELTASVDSAAHGAKRANTIVTEAREAAASSGTVVQQTVKAMSEIEHSSEQISRIIGVIDEIAFQTNLLALNAGVEAARAADAGRGFAVVASEVRALAQRSSEAAREISNLISTSGEHVKKGVSLVDKAGEVLTGIASTIGTVAEHVSEIAASAREQATGVSEINEAMGRLDQVTQQNVAMFEETMAASQALTVQAEGLVTVTRGFQCSEASGQKPALPNAPDRDGSQRKASGATTNTSPRPAKPTGTATAPSRAAPAISGNLAVEAQDDDDWEEF